MRLWALRAAVESMTDLLHNGNIPHSEHRFHSDPDASLASAARHAASARSEAGMFYWGTRDRKNANQRGSTILGRPE